MMLVGAAGTDCITVGIVVGAMSLALGTETGMGNIALQMVGECHPYLSPRLALPGLLVREKRTRFLPTTYLSLSPRRIKGSRGRLTPGSLSSAGPSADRTDLFAAVSRETDKPRYRGDTRT